MPQLVEEGGAERALLVAAGVANGLRRDDAPAARALAAWRRRRRAAARGGGRRCRTRGAGDEEEGEGAGRWGYATRGEGWRVSGRNQWIGQGR